MSIQSTAVAVLVTACIVGSAVPGAYQAGKHGERVKRDAQVSELNRAHDADLAAIDRANREALATAQQATLDAERTHALRIAAIDAAHTKAMDEQKSISNRTIAGLRDGTVRLRSQYATRACSSDGGASGVVPSAGASAGVGDGGAQGGFGTADVIAILGAAAEGDGYAVQLRACQAIVRADRGGNE